MTVDEANGLERNLDHLEKQAQEAHAQAEQLHRAAQDLHQAITDQERRSKKVGRDAEGSVRNQDPLS